MGIAAVGKELKLKGVNGIVQLCINICKHIYICISDVFRYFIGLHVIFSDMDFGYSEVTSVS